MTTAEQRRKQIAQLIQDHPGGSWAQALFAILCYDLEICQTELAYEREQRRICEANHVQE